MSNYVKSTNFATKDTLPTGDSNKIVKGTELDNEFNSIAGAISSKADLASPALTGTPTAPTAVFGSNTTQLATTAFVTAALQAVYPVGSIYINAASSSNPSSLIGFGTWVEFGAGKVIVGHDSSDALFDTLEETGGSKNAVVVSHTHTATSTVTDAGHTHKVANTDNTSNPLSSNPNNSMAQQGWSGDFGYYLQSSSTAPTLGNTSSAITGISVSTTVASEGSSGTNANLQPYIVVKMWKRTA